MKAGADGIQRFCAQLLMVLSLSTAGCASIRVVDDDGDDGDNPPTGAEEPNWTAACPMPSGLEQVDSSALGSCSNEPLEGTLSLQNAEDVLYRVVHEAGHIGSMIAGSDGGLFTLTESNGAHFSASTDDGYVVGALPATASESETGACAVVEFGCWTGGHGGWGPSALAGVALIEVTISDEVVTHVRIASDSMWLVESGTLSGTPRTTVSVELAVLDGAVSEMDATIGEHRITQ